ncbi:hypothetical protein LCI18_003387 [Fusarium solani-melongenae]|uniref:Uncharacterized protein n=1 Tax=Fusarium solani subsp. cucurbitae TaxID=2747967 RepID=A0ACD3YU78_FUSSC|nr:hypothetical protein LCI18_003387 [Fusarium solani-melongenae]
MSGQSDAANWISAISSLTAAIIAIVTLLTFYIGAIQLLSQNRMYRLGLSWRSLGPWQSTVAKWALFGLQRRISSPTVRLKFLTESQWKPNVTFPVGFTKNKNDCIEKAELVQANASWVNFMQALGLSPDDSHIYDIRDASELVNGIVPMHWTGKDLVGICSMLGFQAAEDSPSFKLPMPLPMQWSGPLGWIQFRSSTNGCVAEFRLRMPLHNQIVDTLHVHYRGQSLDLALEAYSLRSRLWNSINGLALGGNWALYLGGTDGDARPQEVEEESGLTQDALLEDLMSNDYSDEKIKRILLGKRERQPKVPRRDAERNGLAKSQRKDGDIPDFLNAMLRDRMDSCQLKQVLRPCPGLLSVAVEGELAYSRGLIVTSRQGTYTKAGITNCQEYDRKYTKAEDVNYEQYPYNLGNLYMGSDLLHLMKEALTLLQPDGFYFSPTYHLCRDLHDIYHDIEGQSNEQAKSECGTDKAAATISSSQQRSRKCLAIAMKLCNDLQDTRKKARACFSVDDMRLLAKAASTLRDVVLAPKANEDKQKPQDLLWAMLYCGELSRDVFQVLKTANVSDFLAARVICKNEVLDYEAFRRAAAQKGEET